MLLLQCLCVGTHPEGIVTGVCIQGIYQSSPTAVPALRDRNYPLTRKQIQEASKWCFTFSFNRTVLLINLYLDIIYQQH